MLLPLLRRGVLAIAVLCGGWCAAPPDATAGVSCTPEAADGWRSCQAALDAPLVQRMLRPQERSRWCWAAALSMVFARYGHDVPQAEIVERLYGVAGNLGMPTPQLVDAIARDWPSGGRILRASTRHQAASPGGAIPASVTLLASSLARDTPLILSAGGHAVVVVGIAYEERGPWVRITGGTVIDPLPGVGLRPLRPHELAVAVLASVEVASL